MAAESTAVADRPQPARARHDARMSGPRRWLMSRRTDLIWLSLTIVACAIGALLPLQVNHGFYFWNDSESYFLPNWYVIGEQLRSGSFPILRADSWLGGNWAGEAQMGIWNPVLLVVALVVSLIPDLAVSAALVKIVFLGILAAGVYLLSREYGASPASAAAVGVAMPLSGYTLYWDATSWAISLVGFAFLPHLWWTARRFSRGRLGPAPFLIAGVLTMTTGSPYGALGVVVVLLAVAVELLLARDLRMLLRFCVVGLAIGLTGALVFLPLLGIQPVGFRTGGVSNTMGLSPELGQLLNLSTPSYVPVIHDWAAPSVTPAAYLAWFVLPLLPWLRWSALAGVRARAGLIVMGGCYLLFALGPSQLWLFRWPIRLTEYVFLPLLVAFAVMLTAGLRTDRLVARGLGSAAVILFGAYLAWTSDPNVRKRHAIAVVLVVALTAAVIVGYRQRERLVTPILIAGTIGVLALQVQWFQGNLTLIPWYFPHNVSDIRADMADRTEGNTLTIAAVSTDSPEPWQDYLLGNLNYTAGLASLNGYTGMGNQAFSESLCMYYAGAVCPELYDRLFAVDPATGATLAELFQLRTVVVRNGFLPGGTSVTTAPAGWTIAKRTPYSTTLRATTPLAHPDGRVAWSSNSITVVEDVTEGDRAERIRYSGGGTVVLAALAWPGWTAEVEGREIEVQTGRGGLIQLTLPDLGHEATVSLAFEPAGLRGGLVGYAVGLLLGIGYCVFHAWERRRRVPAHGRSDGSRPAGSADPVRPGQAPETTVSSGANGASPGADAGHTELVPSSN